MSNAEIKKRPQVNELSEETLKTLSRIVEISMERVRFGQIDEKKKTQSIVLENVPRNRIYKLTAYPVEPGKEDASDKSTGLDIERINLDLNGDPYSKFELLHLPSDPKQVTKENLTLPRGLTPLDINSVPGDITWTRGREVRQDVFSTALNNLRIKIASK